MHRVPGPVKPNSRETARHRKKPVSRLAWTFFAARVIREPEGGLEPEARMASKSRIRKLRSLKPRHGRDISFCGAPCDADQGDICEDCTEYGHLIRRQRNEESRLDEKP
jgi:hypothetical protein